MPEPDEELVLTFEVDGPPEDLQEWWTDLPDSYEASDPREQPHRIDLVEETEDGGIYETTWRGPLGVSFPLEERLHQEGPGRWRFVVDGPGCTIEDRYPVEPVGDGSHLEIRSGMTYDGRLGKLVRKIMLPNWKERFRETFGDAVAVYEDERSV